MTLKKAEGRRQKAVRKNEDFLTVQERWRRYTATEIRKFSDWLTSWRWRFFSETKHFPRDERYSIIDQIRRSSGSVAANIAEGFRKRQYPNMFVGKLADSDAEAAGTQVWLDFARDGGYLSEERRAELIRGCEEVGRMLSTMMREPERFKPF